MLKKVTIGLAALAAAGFATSAMATPVTSAGGSVPVSIEVLPTVSMWSNDAGIALVLSGANAENSNAVAGSLSVINNVDAKIDAAVSGTLQTGVNFFLFPETDVATANSAIVANSNAPAGALVFTGSTGTSQTLIAHTGVNGNIVSKAVVYAADAPNNLPGAEVKNLTVTYTITQN